MIQWTKEDQTDLDELNAAVERMEKRRKEATLDARIQLAELYKARHPGADTNTVCAHALLFADFIVTRHAEIFDILASGPFLPKG